MGHVKLDYPYEFSSVELIYDCLCSVRMFAANMLKMLYF